MIDQVPLRKLGRVLSVLVKAIGIALTDEAARSIASLVERQTFSMDEFPDVAGCFEHPDGHLIIKGEPGGEVDIDVRDRSIDFIHPNDEVIESIKQSLQAA